VGVIRLFERRPHRVLPCGRCDETPREAVEISRRDFCAVAGCLAAAACTSNSAKDPDAPPGSADAHVGPDAASGGACGGTVTDCGAPPASFTSTPKLISAKFFVVRDSGGLYAVSAKCTHQGATLTNDGTEFYCPRHGATFDYDGNVLGGPVSAKLVHYAMCITSGGNVGVNTSQTVSQSTRMNA
jgi:nitrite reductase/ring-hydroxylating ferredoxin subunit